MGKLFGTTRSVFDLKNEIRKLILEGDIMKPITSDARVFILVMSTFSQYEKAVNYLIITFKCYI